MILDDIFVSEITVNAIVTVNQTNRDFSPDRSDRSDFSRKMTSATHPSPKVTVAQRSDEIIVADGGVLSGPTAVTWAIAFAIGGTAILSNQRQRDAAFAEARSILAHGGTRLQSEVSQTIQSAKKKGMTDLALISVVAEKVKHVIVPFRRGSDDRAPPRDDAGGGSRRPTCSMQVNIFTDPSASGYQGGRVIYNAKVEASGNGTPFVPRRVDFLNEVADPVTVPPNHNLVRGKKGASLTITPAQNPKSASGQPVYYTPSAVSTMRSAGLCTFNSPDGKTKIQSAQATVTIDGASQPSTLRHDGSVLIHIRLK